MANLHSKFLEFYDNIQITNTKLDKMQTSHNNLRDIIRTFFKNNHPEYRPTFFIQGSYKMGTTIRTKDDECDLDDGVYFIPKPNVTGNTLQNWVIDAVDNVTDARPIHKNKCVRVSYAAGYHIDLPVYIKDTNDITEHPLLAVRDNDYQESDPREVVKWFESKKKDNAQLVRIISYLKAWSDNMPYKLCPGLVWTTLAAETQFKRMADRDDIAIVRTMENIYSALSKSFKCIVQGTPYDDMFAEYDEAKKKRLMDYLQDFIDKGNKALEEKNLKKASKIWISLFGERFKEAEDVVEEGANLNTLYSLAASVSEGKASTSKNGCITEGTGILNKGHIFYGDEGI